MKIKTDLLKKYIKDNYANDTMSTNNLILLVHGTKEAEYMSATLLGAYKIPYDKMIETKDNSKWAEAAWNGAKEYEIKTYSEIERIILDATTKYL